MSPVDAAHVLQPILVRKQRCLVLSSDDGWRATGGSFRSWFSFDEVFSFPEDFDTTIDHAPEPPNARSAIVNEGEHPRPGPLWRASSVAELWQHPDTGLLLSIMKHYSGPEDLRAIAAQAGFDVSRVTFHRELDRAARELVERSFKSDHLRAIIVAMGRDPSIRRWRDDIEVVLGRARDA